MANEQNQNRELFENALRGIEADIANVGVHLTIDSHARQVYAKQIKAMTVELRSNAMAGRIPWSKAAAQAQETRNVIMQIIRTRSTPVGLSMAQQLKREGKTLNELIARKTTLWPRGDL